MLYRDTGHGCSEDDISEVMQEITALANCDCPQITKYFDSMLLPDSSKLVIAMELMSCSGADLVRFPTPHPSSMCTLPKQVNVEPVLSVSLVDPHWR